MIPNDPKRIYNRYIKFNIQITTRKYLNIVYKIFKKFLQCGLFEVLDIEISKKLKNFIENIIFLFYLQPWKENWDADEYSICNCIAEVMKTKNRKEKMSVKRDLIRYLNRSIIDSRTHARAHTHTGFYYKYLTNTNVVMRIMFSCTSGQFLCNSVNLL